MTAEDSFVGILINVAAARLVDVAAPGDGHPSNPAILFMAGSAGHAVRAKVFCIWGRRARIDAPCLVPAIMRIAASNPLALDTSSRFWKTSRP
jgi:hypothetical protein